MKNLSFVMFLAPETELPSTQSTLRGEKVGAMSAEGAAPEVEAPTRRSSRQCVVTPPALKSENGPGQLAMQAAYKYMVGAFDTPRMAAEDYGVDRQLVHYYVRKLVAQGMTMSERVKASAEPAPASAEPAPASAPEAEPAVDGSLDPYTKWCKAWAFAYHKGQEGLGYRAASRAAREKFGIGFSATSAKRAMLSDGKLPKSVGRPLVIPRKVEENLVDLCLCLREMNLPVFRFMVLNYVNVLIADTDIAEQLKDKEVKREWYYKWLGRSTRLKT